MPERVIPSLGGQIGCWIQDHCAVPDGEHRGEPFRLTGEQWDFLLRFYALDDAGRFAFGRGGMLVRPAKWGKGPFSAAVIAAEAAGPVRFAGWDAAGDPIGKPWPTPWVQAVAVSEEQTANVWRALIPMMRLGAIAHEVDDVGLTRVNLPGGGRIEFATAAARSRVGQRTTFGVFDELGFWLAGNHGHELADAMLRNLAGMSGRFLGTTNAWARDEESVAERFSTDDGVLVDDVEPGAGSLRNQTDRRRMLRRVYGDSVAGCEAQGNATGRIEPWIDLDRIDAEIVALVDRDPGQAERFFLNRKIAAGARAAFNADRFAELAAPDHAPAPRGLIVVGIDGARFDDTLAIVATEVETGFQWLVWAETRPEGAPEDYEHDLDAADGAMVELFERWQVWRAYIDPQWIEILVERWLGRWGDKRVFQWFTNRPRQIATAVRRYADALAAGELTHDGGELLAAHVTNAVRRDVNARDDDGRRLWTIAKAGRHSPRKIDAAMAAVLSWEARSDAKRDGAREYGRAQWP
ncbi:MAG: phage terminase family protein [Actinomycetota bacterium]|nr:phage terminase family protein [Actinomycetota bacterium]